MVHHIAEDKIEAKFSKLVSEGRSMLSSCGFDGHEYHQRFPPTSDYTRFRTEAMNLIHKVCGPSSSHHQAIKGLAESSKTSTNAYYYADCLGVLEAAYADFKGGLLSELRLLGIRLTHQAPIPSMGEWKTILGT